MHGHTTKPTGTPPSVFGVDRAFPPGLNPPSEQDAGKV